MSSNDLLITYLLTYSLTYLRTCLLQGLPDEDGVRSVMWKVLLGFLPPEASCWDESLARSRASYQDLLSELIVNPQAREDPQPLPPRSTQRKRQQTFTTSSSPPSSPDHSLVLTSQSSRVPAPPLFSSPPPAAFTGKTGTKQTQLVSLLDAVCSNPSTESVPQFKPASVCRMREVAACRVSDDPLSQATGSAWKGYDIYPIILYIVQLLEFNSNINNFLLFVMSVFMFCIYFCSVGTGRTGCCMRALKKMSSARILACTSLQRKAEHTTPPSNEFFTCTQSSTPVSNMCRA